MRVEYLSCDCCGAPISLNEVSKTPPSRWISVYTSDGGQHECVTTDASGPIGSLRLRRSITDTCPKCRDEINDIVFNAVAKIRSVGKTRCLPPEAISGC